MPSPERKAFYNARDRCIYSAEYRAHGIQFKFTSFAQWYRELGPRPSSGHSVDRIDNNGHYAPGNMRWATKSEQGKNRRHWTTLRTQVLLLLLYDKKHFAYPRTALPCKVMLIGQNK